MTSITLTATQPTRRRIVRSMACLFLINACGAKPMRVVLHLVAFSYWDRPIFEINVDGIGDEASAAYPNTGKGVTAGVSLSLGPKKVTWRLGGPEGLPRNGDTLVNKNRLELVAFTPGAKYLGVHIYPDETVEFSTSVGRPEPIQKV